MSARGDAHLAGDQVDVGDLLGDGVLHLDPRVHLDEDVVAALVEQELDGARIGVVDLAGECDCVRTDLGPQLLGQVRRGRQLDDLLVAALHAAVALEQVHHVAVPVGQDLHLDVARVEHRLLEIDHRVAERRLRLAAGGLDRFRQRGGSSPAHPAAATAGHRLDEQRKLHARAASTSSSTTPTAPTTSAPAAGRRPGGRDRARLVARQLQHIGPARRT